MKKVPPDQNMNDKNDKQTMQQPVSRRGGTPRLIIRAGNGTLSFLLPHGDGTVDYAPYTVRSGVSMAANLRSAFRDAELSVSYTHLTLPTICSV